MPGRAHSRTSATLADDVAEHQWAAPLPRGRAAIAGGDRPTNGVPPPRSGPSSDGRCGCSSTKRLGEDGNRRSGQPLDRGRWRSRNDSPTPRHSTARALRSPVRTHTPEPLKRRSSVEALLRFVLLGSHATAGVGASIYRRATVSAFAEDRSQAERASGPAMLPPIVVSIAQPLERPKDVTASVRLRQPTTTASASTWWLLRSRRRSPLGQACVIAFTRTEQRGVARAHCCFGVGRPPGSARSTVSSRADGRS